MSRIGKVVKVTTLIEQNPQQWHQQHYIGVVTDENSKCLKILNYDSSVVEIFKNAIFTIENIERD